MLSADRDALLCDLAETYQIYDVYGFRPRQVAIYAAGLRGDSRIKMKMDGVHPRLSLEIFAHIADELALLRYYFTAKDGDDTPVLFTDLIRESYYEKTSSSEGFDSGEAFDEAWKNLTGRR